MQSNTSAFPLSTEKNKIDVQTCGSFDIPESIG